MSEIPEEAMDPCVPAGTAPAKAAGEHLAPFWCTHGVKFQYQPVKGGYLPAVAAADAMHPDLPLRTPGTLPIACQPSTAFDPAEYPNAGPASLQ